MTDARSREQRIRELERRAAALLTLKRQARPKRPIIIEFCGSPKAGKSTRINSLEVFLKRNGFRVKTISERAALSPIRNKRSPFFNLWTLGSVLAEISAVIEGDEENEIILIDRGLFDALCWFTWFKMQGQLTAEDATPIFNFVSHSLLMSKMDLVVMLRADAQTSFDREYATLLTTREGSIMNTSALESYGAALDLALDEYEKAPRAIHEIDTTGREQDEVSVEVTDLVLDVLEDQLIEKVACVSRERLEELRKGYALDLDELAALPVSWVLRPDAEADQSLVQLVSVACIFDSGEDGTDVLVVRKSRKSTEGSPGRGKSPERNQTLAYVGGHVRVEDSFGEEADLRAICASALRREVREEIGLDVATSESPHLIWDVSRARSAQHLAVAFPLKVKNLRTARLRPDDYEFSRDPRVTSPLQVMTLDELATVRNFEAWSNTLVDRLFGVQVENYQTSLDFDLVDPEVIERS